MDCFAALAGIGNSVGQSLNSTWRMPNLVPPIANAAEQTLLKVLRNKLIQEA